MQSTEIQTASNFMRQRRGCLVGGNKSAKENSPKITGDILTSDQKMAFREVFDLFDSNGGGSIDADELEEALHSADIHLTKEEINEVLSSMDKDGNGEIDFEEFLQLMTNTERFLESMCKESTEETRQREVLLFEALTQFMKKSALHSINEIVGYYHNKYKKVQAPHVIRHYAAGARLIGLSEQQIRRHLDQLRRSSSDNKSPYAQPPYTFYSISQMAASHNKQQTRNTASAPANERVKLQNITEEDSAAKIPEENLKLLVPDNSTQTTPVCRGRIRLKIIWDHKDEENSKASKTLQSRCSNVKEDHLPSATQPTHLTHNTKKRRGWVAQRFAHTTVRQHLPVLTTNLVQQQIAEDEGWCCGSQQQRNGLNFDDMYGLRRKVKDLANIYHGSIQKVKCDQADRHWNNLDVQHMPSPRLRRSFKRAFDAYSDYRNTPVSSLC